MKKLTNNSGDTFVVLQEYTRKVGKRNHSFWVIQFEETGTVIEVYKANASNGKARDPFKPSLCGVGYRGIYSKPPYYHQASRLWSNMIKRCYDENYEAGYFGRGYTVSNQWKNFSNFLNDIPKLDNFNKWLEGFNSDSPKYNLDKDLTLKGNKIYCKEFCNFILESINKSEGAKNGKPYTKKPKPNKVGKI